MKKFAIALMALFVTTVSASAMSYDQARNEALFLTDKMAYELNLTEDQYEAAYEINLDYLLGVNTVDDIYGAYWTHRNIDLGYVLLDWQYREFCAAAYFYRPIYWSGGYWHFGIYARYPRRDYFFYGRPHFYTVYRGGHSWRMNGGRSWYNGRRDWGRPADRREVGMRDGLRRGDYRNGYDNRNRTFGNLNRGNAGRQNVGGNRTFGNGTQRAGSFGNGSTPQNRVTQQNRNTQGQRTFGGARQFQTQPQSSTRTTVRQPGTTVNQQNRSFGSGARTLGGARTMNRGSFERSTPSTPSRSTSTPRQSSRSFGGHR